MPTARRPRPPVAAGRGARPGRAGRARVAGAAVAVVLAAGPAWPAGAPAASPEPAGMPSAAAWDHAVADARRAAARRGERVRFAIRVDDRTWAYRGAEQTNANSLVKAMVLTAYLRRGSVRSRALSGGERALLSPMIRRSANGPVPALLARMGGTEPLRRLARAVGMRRFAPVRVLWGASRITATDQVRLFSRLFRLLPPRHRDYALGLLRSIVPSQRWGVPRVRPAGWRLLFKSGWNDRGRVNQAVRLDCHGHAVTIAILVDGSSHGRSIDVVRETGRELLQPLRRRGPAACSSVRPPAVDTPARRAAHA